MSTTKKKSKASRRREPKSAKAEGDREVRQEAHRQDALSADESNLPTIAGPDPRSTDEEMYLHTEDMLRLLLLQSEMQRAQGDISLAKAELEKAELQFLKRQMEINKKHSAAQVAAAAAKGKLTRFHKALERGYKITISKITFDDETGLIKQHTE